MHARITLAASALVAAVPTFADTPAFAALGLKDQPVLSIRMQHLALFHRVAIDLSRQRIRFDVPADIARALRAARHSGGQRPQF